MREPFAVLGRSHLSSTGTADPKSATPPAGTRAFLVSASGAALLTVEGTAPAANVGLVVPAGFDPRPIPVCPNPLKVAGNAVASEVEVVWLG